MELLQQPEIRNKYEKCKYVVKYWEHQFKKKNGRLPSKLDIREANHEIRLAYKTYFNLKSAALEKSFQDVDGFTSDNEDQENTSVNEMTNSSHTETGAICDESFSKSIEEEVEPNKKESENTTEPLALSEKVNTNKTWGSHLTNVTEAKRAASKIDANTSYTKKLMKNSSFSKRNLRKSQSFNLQSESNLNVSNSFSFSQPTSTSSDPFTASSQNSHCDAYEDVSSNEKSCILSNETLRITKPIEPVLTKPLNIAQSFLDENYKTTRVVDAGWMKRVAASSGTKLSNKNLIEQNFKLSHQLNTPTNNDYDSDDIIGDSDDEEDSKLRFSKRRKLNNSQPVEGPKVALELNESQQVNAMNVVPDHCQTPLEETPVLASKVIKPVHEPLREEIRENEVKQKQIKNIAIKQKDDQNYLNVPARKSTRVRKTVMDIEKDDEPDYTEEVDPDFQLTPDVVYDFVDETEKAVVSEPTNTSKPPKKSAKTPKNTRKGRKKTEKKESNDTAQEGEEEDQASYELEFSVKPRRITVPRDPDFKNVIKKSKARKQKQKESNEDKDNEPLIKTKQQIAREKFEKKVESGNLNDNFVRIDIQKKVYARGKKTMNFSKYKKKMWKQNKKNNALCGPEMDMRGCDGGQLTCFNCGKVGHFAAKCPEADGDKLLPLAAGDEDYCPFPTLEEASEMARGSVLAVRKTREADGPNVETFNQRDTEGEQLLEEVKEGEEIVAESQEENTEEEDEDDGDENVFQQKDMFDDDDEADLLAATLKLEEHVQQIDQQQFIDDARRIKPYYELEENGNVKPTPQEVFDVLQMFGHESFRPGQEKAIMRILSGQSTLVTLSTGSGKSLCYQIPAYLYSQRQPCIALVISPLVSLMEDQVTGIPKFLTAECLHTSKTKLQRERILNTITTGNLNILLMSPEAVVAGEKQTGFGSLLRKLPPIAFACIDEAHCVSQWSHNFRPSYLMICSILKERLGVQTILGLTATATRATSDSIISHLAIPDGRLGIISDIPLPNNLRLTVSKDGHRDQALLNLLLSERFADLKSIIIYCTRRQECERIAAFLRTSLKDEKTEPEATKSTGGRKRKKTNVQAEPYHAGIAPSKRRSVQNSFMRGDLRIVVATVAFGMGINKSDIRAVIHYNLPRNFESYVQEVGRAGRDGLPAHCHLFLDSQGRDENELQRHIFSDSIDRHVIRKLLEKIFIPCTCKAACPKHEVAFAIQDTVQNLDLPEENIATLLCYLELHDQKYIEVLSPAYVTCKITAYGTANYIRKAAKDCPPLAMALAMFGNKDNEKENVFEFPVVDVAAAMGWDSGICKFKLKNLEWVTENNQPKRSFLTVQFLNLGFRLLAPGNLSGEQLDEALDTLHQRVVDQEKCSLLQLRALHETVTEVAEASYRMCITEHVSDKEEKLKRRLRDYFDSAEPLANCELKPKQCDEGVVANDVRAMINMYRDNSFTGRAVARIFYGIQSPNYPAVIWGRCRYWRAHLGSDFHKIVQIATREILRNR